LIFGICVKVESFSFGKLIAIILVVGGVVVINLDTVETGGSGKFPILGNSLALFSSIAYGAYTVYIDYKIKDVKKVSMARFFGFVGVINLFTLWPILLIFHFTGFEKLELPSIKVGLFLLGNGIIGTVISDMLWGLSVKYASPLTASIGLSLTIPFAIVVDFFFRDSKFSFTFLIGSLLVILGFTLVNITSQDKELKFLKWLKTKLCKVKEETKSISD